MNRQKRLKEELLRVINVWARYIKSQFVIITEKVTMGITGSHTQYFFIKKQSVHSNYNIY